MYICLCRCITEKQIRHAIEQGCHSLRQLNMQLGIAKQCGKCGQHAKDILKQQITPLKSQS